MKLLVFIVLSLSLIACHSNKTKEIVYSEHEKELIALLDSIGGLDKDKLVEKILLEPDSVLNSQTDLNITLSDKDFDLLKKAVAKKQISTTDAKRIFPDFKRPKNFLEEENFIELYSFDDDTTAFQQFAVVLNDFGMTENEIYFFQGKKLIAKHHVDYRYTLHLEHFKDENGKTVIYYPVNFMNGTDIWWFQSNFYRYENEKLTPVLTELSISNFVPSFSIRSFELEAQVVNTNPLKMKFIYHSKFDYKTEWKKFVSSLTTVTYKLDNQTSKYVADFSNTDLDKYKLLSFSLADNDLLFVSAYHVELKEWLTGKDPIKRKVIFDFLKELRKRINENS